MCFSTEGLKLEIVFLTVCSRSYVLSVFDCIKDLRIYLIEKYHAIQGSISSVKLEAARKSILKDSLGIVFRRHFF